MKKIKFIAILMQVDVGYNPTLRLDDLTLHLVTPLDKTELEEIRLAFIEKKQLKITIKEYE